MKWKDEWKKLIAILTVFLVCFYLPVGITRFDNAVLEAFQLVKWYAREHVLLCLIPAFFIAGGIAVFISQGAVIKYFGAKANKFLSYAVAAISGTILAVCSCTVLPLFMGIYRMGAGIGPATAFLYSGPAINVLAIILTARVLGYELGIARAVGAVIFSVIIGLLMHLIFRKEDQRKSEEQLKIPKDDFPKPLWQSVSVMVSMIAILIFANWAISGEFVFGVACCPIPTALEVSDLTGKQVNEDSQFIYLKTDQGTEKKIDKKLIRYKKSAENPIYAEIHYYRFFIAGIFLVALIIMLKKWFKKQEIDWWFESTWSFAKQILPLLLIGVLIAGVLLGRVGHEGLIPSEWVAQMVGGNSLWANFFASFAGAFMYFATLTEIPILQGLLANGMGKGPALALLLAGPALSLPNMLVINSVLGPKKTITFVGLVIIMATISGMVFGIFFG